VSVPKDLVFQLTVLQLFREGTDLGLGFVNMESKVLGPAVRARPRTRAARSGRDEQHAVGPLRA
jgi:hypothetical protein